MFDINKYPKSLGQDTVLKKVGHFLDVFTGKSGWENHTRLKVVSTPKGKFLSHVHGKKLPTNIFKTLSTQVT